MGINFWECDPTDNENNCIFYYRGDPYGEGAQYKEYNFEVPCKCSLATSNQGGDEPDEGNVPNWTNNPDAPLGYCGSILGT